MDIKIFYRSLSQTEKEELGRFIDEENRDEININAISDEKLYAIKKEIEIRFGDRMTIYEFWVENEHKMSKRLSNGLEYHCTRKQRRFMAKNLDFMDQLTKKNILHIRDIGRLSANEFIDVAKSSGFIIE